jgi:hypothetical protein
LGLVPRRLDNSCGHPSQATFFHGVIWMGCTPYSAANSWLVRSPRSASRTTFALNSPRCCRRGIVIVPFSPTAHDPHLLHGPVFGEHYRLAAKCHNLSNTIVIRTWQVSEPPDHSRNRLAGNWYGIVWSNGWTVGSRRRNA